MPEVIRSAVFVDLDSVIAALAAVDRRAAAGFLQDIPAWLGGLEAGSLVRNGAAGGAPTHRNVVVRRCYAGTNLSPEARGRLLDAGFQIVECPSVPGRRRNAADIRLAMDVLDSIDHRAEFDEYLLLAAETDLTPLLARLAEHYRRAAAFANDASSRHYRALTGGVVTDRDLAAAVAGGLPADDAAVGAGADRPAEASAIAGAPGPASAEGASASAGLEPAAAPPLSGQEVAVAEMAPAEEAASTGGPEISPALPEAPDSAAGSAQPPAERPPGMAAPADMDLEAAAPIFAATLAAPTAEEAGPSIHVEAMPSALLDTSGSELQAGPDMAERASPAGTEGPDEGAEAQSEPAEVLTTEAEPPAEPAADMAADAAEAPASTEPADPESPAEPVGTEQDGFSADAPAASPAPEPSAAAPPSPSIAEARPDAPSAPSEAAAGGAAGAKRRFSEAQLEGLADGIVRLVVDKVRASERPVALYALAIEVRRTLGYDVIDETRWAGYQNFRSLLEARLPEGYAITRRLPSYVYDRARHGGSEPAQPAGMAANPPVSAPADAPAPAEAAGIAAIGAALLGARPAPAETSAPAGASQDPPVETEPTRPHGDMLAAAIAAVLTPEDAPPPEADGAAGGTPPAGPAADMGDVAPPPGDAAATGPEPADQTAPAGAASGATRPDFVFDLAAALDAPEPAGSLPPEAMEADGSAQSPADAPLVFGVAAALGVSEEAGEGTGPAAATDREPAGHEPAESAPASQPTPSAADRDLVAALAEALSDGTAAPPESGGAPPPASPQKDMAVAPGDRPVPPRAPDRPRRKTWDQILAELRGEGRR